ncbi:3-dehydroquinate synthase family protein [Sphingomonas sp. LY160]|uniref:3-dehydroquinate synthase n=1 Tax=Sphingomonas sp. LY160 TaxID=3095342 RepID=UPI002ADEDF78|nr:3-dehydroquinate synthase family protein [Sphingomonas sp. LY160]MEA1071526.1 3-dehydroquinate synthase family protein [Sphingomonas sp. LY160]
MRIRSSLGDYRVCFLPNALADLSNDPGDLVFLTDERFAAMLPADRAVSMPATEGRKSLGEVERISAAMRAMGANRGTTLVGVGGGIVQDVGSFVASIYMRGIAWRFVPTTLLAMVDSCIGGKSAVNVGGLKNLLGTVHPPRDVLIDPAFCKTLEAEQIVGGLCEAAKVCFAMSPRRFDRYLALRPDEPLDENRLAAIIGLSLVSKKWFVEHDEFDRGERLKLNFGHTFAHAIEDASDFAVPHGVAVGMGMRVAIETARRLGTATGTRTHLLGTHIAKMLGGLPSPAAIDVDRMMESFVSDKKHSRDSLTLILPDQDDRLAIRRLPRDVETAALIRACVERVLA